MSGGVPAKNKIMNERNLTKTEILEDIRDLENKLVERKQQLKEAEIREYDSALKGFLDRFSIHSAEDVYRLQSALEGIQGAVKHPQVNSPSGHEAEKESGLVSSQSVLAEDEATVRDVSFQDVPIPVHVKEKELPVNGLELESEAVHEPEPEQEAVPEESIPEEPFPAPVQETYDEAVEIKPEEDMEEIKADSAPEADEDPFHIDYSIFDRFSDENGDIPVEVPDDNTAADSLMDFTDSIPAEFDNSGIDAGLIIAVYNPDPSISKFKSRPAIVNAEKILLEAIAEAVKEGWVEKGEVIDRFFKTDGSADGDFYAEAESIVDHLESIWEEYGFHAGVSEAKLKEFMTIPFHTRAKAAACARSDLQIALA